MRFHAVFALLVAWGLVANSTQAADHSYPYRKPYLATATSAVLSGNDDCVESSILRVRGLPGRNRLPTLEGRGDASLALYQHDAPAPVLFILAGLGANPYFGVAPYLANVFYTEGFHVVIVPSPMSWNFALAASRTGVPGYAPSDARDVYELMQKTLASLRTDHNLKATAIYFMGISLGALEGAYLSVIDADEKKIGFSRYLLVNPPVNLAYTVDRIDGWSKLAAKFGTEKSRELIVRALAIADRFSYTRGDDPEVFDRFVKEFDTFTTEEIQFLIAANLQNQLPELVYVTQAIHDQNVLSAPKTDMRKRLSEARTFTFSDYNLKIALPWWRQRLGNPQANLDTFIERSSLRRIVDRLRDNPRVHIMHNADDFLSERKSIEALKQTMADQMTVYPYGGHLGNLWYPVNQNDFLEFFRSPLGAIASK